MEIQKMPSYKTHKEDMVLLREKWKISTKNIKILFRNNGD
jgi:hypothetical protein